MRDVGGLAADLLHPRLMDQDLAERQGHPLPFSPPASSTDAADAAIPAQIVAICGLMYCIVSYIAKPAVTLPPGL